MASSTPFEWLSGGLFFGNNNSNNSNSNSKSKPFDATKDNVDSISDPLALLQGLDKDLARLFPSDPAGNDDDADNNSNNNSASQAVQARLSRLRYLLYDERRTHQQANTMATCRVAHDTMQGLIVPDSESATTSTALIVTLLNKLPQLAFESKKDVAAIFNYLLVCGLDGTDAELYSPTMHAFGRFVQCHFSQVLDPIMAGHDSAIPDVVLHCGSMYRACVKTPILYQELVATSDRVQQYVLVFLDKYCHSPNFDVASDAMESLRVVFTANDAADFLQRDYKALFEDLFQSQLLSHSNYIIRRMALQILSTVLLKRSNYSVMMQYVVSKQNLITSMLLLRDTSPHITLDAFHVFKIFVANPQKPPDIIKILCDNKVKLIKYLDGLHKDKEATDAQFRDEKALVIQTLEDL